MLCSPWATIADLPESRPNLDDATWTRYLLAASQILFDLSGRKWHGGGCTASDTWADDLCGCGSAWSYVGGRAGSCGCGWPTRVRLRSTEGVEVTTVHVDGALVPAGSYFVDRGWLVRTDTRGWPVAAGRTVVAYEWGLAPPQAGVQAVVTLAVELAKAGCSDRTCRLPQRLQTLTRQGVTATFIDPQTFLDDRRTGLTEIDLWLAAVNPNRARQVSRVWSPEIAARGRTPGP